MADPTLAPSPADEARDPEVLDVARDEARAAVHDPSARSLRASPVSRVQDLVSAFDPELETASETNPKTPTQDESDSASWSEPAGSPDSPRADSAQDAPKSRAPEAKSDDDKVAEDAQPVAPTASASPPTQIVEANVTRSVPTLEKAPTLTPDRQYTTATAQSAQPQTNLAYPQPVQEPRRQSE